MARPRVFISSTFYDLRHVRDDLSRFVTSLGYEPVRHEAGDIPYGKDEPLEVYAQKEVEISDIFVLIVGNRFGTESKTAPHHSITETELLRACDRSIPIYIFVEKAVWAEYQTYRVNKGNLTVKYSSVDDLRVFQFLDFLQSLPVNNPTTDFENPTDICEQLRLQWAGLFQRFLAEQRRIAEIHVLEEMKGITCILKQAATALTEASTRKDDALRTILLPNHPVFRRLANALGIGYRLFFASRTELEETFATLGYSQVRAKHRSTGAVEEWEGDDPPRRIAFRREFFDPQGALIPIAEVDWSEDWLEWQEIAVENPVDDEIPF